MNSPKPSFSFETLQATYVDQLKRMGLQQGISLQNSHALEIIAAYHGFKSYAALGKETLKIESYTAMSLPSFSENMARQRANDLLNVDPSIITALVTILHLEVQAELDPTLSLIRRLMRNLANNGSFDLDTSEISGGVVLTTEELDQMIKIAKDPNFEDFLVVEMRLTTLQILEYIKGIKDKDGLHHLAPDPVLNLLAAHSEMCIPLLYPAMHHKEIPHYPYPLA